MATLLDRNLNKEILKLSIPSILANLTVPMVGMVDTAVAGHLPFGSAAAFIGAISVGAMLFNLLYWNFGFIRTGTGGLTAQAFGRGDKHDCALILTRALSMAMVSAAVIIILRKPFARLAMLCVHASSEVEDLARSYFLTRIWAAPATLGLMAFSGWFVGMQDSMSSMWKDLVINGVNVIASIVLATGAGLWRGMGFPGIAWGTVIAQYSGLAFCTTVCAVKYGKGVISTLRANDISGLFRTSALHGFMKMNLDLLGRSAGFTLIYIGYTLIASEYGDTILACSSIMMQLLMLFSYFTDGFAYAGEALSGRFIGARDTVMLRKTVRYVFVWSMSIALLFVIIYLTAGTPLVRLMTDDAGVVGQCRKYLPWLVLMPPLGCAAFTWDGVYLGATASRGMFIAMAGAAVCFFAVWFGGKAVVSPGGSGAMHLLLAAYFAHLAFRTVWLTVRYDDEILSRVP